MRSIFQLSLIGACLIATGCTHLALQRRTVKQASTLTDLQHQQVVDNLAMFACNRDAMAWHLKLSAGSTQVSDEGRGIFGMEFGGGNPALFLPGFEGARGVVDQWSGVPAVDADDLEVLQLAYQKAIDPGDSEGEITPAIYRKIGELSVNFNIVLSKETLDEVILYRKPDPKLTCEEFKTQTWDLQRRNVELHKRLDDQFKQLVNISDLAVSERIMNELKKLIGEKPTDITPEVALPPADIGFADDTTAAADKAAAEKAAAQLLEELKPSISTGLMQSRVATEDEIVRLTAEACDLPFIMRYPYNNRTEHNIHEIDQIQAKIKTLEELASDEKYSTPWFHRGCKNDVPKCACYVGHSCSCGCECYVWVTPEGRGMLRDFTIAILTLAPLERNEAAVPLPGAGVMFSPTLTGR